MIIPLCCDTCRFHDNPDWVCECGASRYCGRYTDPDNYCRCWEEGRLGDE